MKKIAGLALAAAIISPISASACEITDTILYAANSFSSGEYGAAQLIGITNFDGNNLDTFELLVDGELTYGGFGSVDGIEYFSDRVTLPVNSTHSITHRFTMKDGEVIECGATVTIPEENAPPVIVHDRMEHYDNVQETENGVLVTVFASVIDTDENVAREDIEFEFVTAPDGVEVPAAEIHENETTIAYQEIEFTVPGDYSLRVKATDAYGEVAYSKPIEFAIGGCKTSTVAEHVVAGRAFAISGSHFTTGAYVYLGYLNGSDVVALEKIEEMGEWWVVCP